jgi:hypothetical protein
VSPNPSTESEYRALVEASKEAMWIKNLYHENGIVKKGPIPIYYDKQSAIKNLGESDVPHQNQTF